MFVYIYRVMLSLSIFIYAPLCHTEEEQTKTKQKNNHIYYKIVYSYTASLFTLATTHEVWIKLKIETANAIANNSKTVYTCAIEIEMLHRQ